MMIEFPISETSTRVAVETRVALVPPARFEGADGNVRASQVGKETLAGIFSCLLCFLNSALVN